MNRKKIILLSLLLNLIIFRAIGQDPYFSQSFMSPMTINPALIGKGVSDMRLLTNLRSQTWGTGRDAAFRTTSVSFETKLAKNKFQEDQLAFGLSLVNDASNSGLLNKNFISLGFAFNKQVSKYSSLGVGVSYNYANMLLDQGQFSFQSQFGSFGFIRSLPSYDPVFVTNKSYSNAEGGIHYSYMDSVWGFNFGTAIFHAAASNDGVYKNSNLTVSPRVSTRASVIRKFKSGDEVHFITNYDRQGENVKGLFTFGSIVKVNLPGDHPINKFSLGLFNRLGNSIYPFIGVESHSWFAGFSYDIVSSDIKTYYNSAQSMEVSFGWQFSAKKKKSTSSHDRMVIY